MQSSMKDSSLDIVPGSPGLPSVVVRAIDGELYKVGDYAFVVTECGEEVFCCRWPEELIRRPDRAADGPFQPLGGGRLQGENSDQSVCREVFEETGGSLELSLSDLRFWQTIRVRSVEPFRYVDDSRWMVGREMNIFVTTIPRSRLRPTARVEEDKQCWEFDWHQAHEVFAANTQLDAAEWVRFNSAISSSCFGLLLPEPRHWQALTLACEIDKGQADKGGTTHLGEIVRMARTVMGDGSELIVALLHHAVEGGGDEIRARLRALPLTSSESEALALVTRSKSMR